MSLDLKQEAHPLGGVEELVAQLRAAERPADQHSVGLEHEKLVYPLESAVPVPYEGERGIGALLASLARLGGYTEFRESTDSPVIALTRGKTTVSLEPGGQFELSGAPWRTA